MKNAVFYLFRNRGRTFYLLLVTRYFLLVTRYSLAVTFDSLLVTFYMLLVTTYSLLVTTFSLLFTRYWLLLTRYCLLFICHYLFVTFCSLILFISFYYFLVKLWRLIDVKNVKYKLVRFKSNLHMEHLKQFQNLF